MNIWTHQEKALERWLKHYDECAEDVGEHDPQERKWAMESFRDCIQVKLLEDGEVKVKWEHRCWWADCKHATFLGEYYCVMAHPKYITWMHPYELALDIKSRKDVSE